MGCLLAFDPAGRNIVRKGVGKWLPSSASIVSLGTTFSSSEYSGSDKASGFASSAFFSIRSLPSQPLLLRGVPVPVPLPLEGELCPAASSSLMEMCVLSLDIV